MRDQIAKLADKFQDLAMLYAITGFLTGIIGGLFGGRQRNLIPVLIYAFGFSQHVAQGTSLAVLLPPIGLVAALRYYKAGHINRNIDLFSPADRMAAAFAAMN